MDNTMISTYESLIECSKLAYEMSYGTCSYIVTYCKYDRLNICIDGNTKTLIYIDQLIKDLNKKWHQINTKGCKYINNILHLIK